VKGRPHPTDHTDVPLGRPPFERIQALLQKWAADHPDIVQLETAGKSVQGRPVYAARLTDPASDNEDKEHVLITALHSGVERTGTTTVLCLMEWLLSSDALAREILQRQVIVCMPVPHPDGYVLGQHGRIYTDWTLEGPKDPDNMPEAVAVKKIMDQYQPEVHADIHGLSMEFERYTMLENSASSYSNLALRCYHRDIIRLMDEAALAEGYASDWQESDAERIFWGPELDSMSEKVWGGRPRVYAATYCYNLYHTIIAASEVCWERSGLLRHRRLLRIGNEVWPKYYPGYPTRVIMSNHYHMITAYGTTAAARRRSRVELWNKQRQLAHGHADPSIEGKILYVCATTPAAARRWLRDKTLKEFAARLAEHPRIHVQPIQRFVEGWPRGQNHPQAFLPIQGGAAAAEQAAPIEHGLSLRLRIFSDRARLTELLLNGYPVARSETDGYLQWAARGITYIQINIPPERLRRDDFFVVTCAYDPGRKRVRWSIG